MRFRCPRCATIVPATEPMVCPTCGYHGIDEPEPAPQSAPAVAPTWIEPVPAYAESMWHDEGEWPDSREGEAPGLWREIRTTDGFSVAALVLSLTVSAVLGVVFGIVGMVQTRKHGFAGHGMAVAGLVIGLLRFLLMLVAIVVWKEPLLDWAADMIESIR